MRAIVVGAGLALLVAAVCPTHVAAQSSDPPALCTSSATIWGSVGAGTDVAAMRAVRAQTPGVCRVLLSRIDARITALTGPRPAAPAADPCIQARTDWSTVQNSTSVAEVQAYQSMTPAACTLWRTRADERIAALQAQAAALVQQQNAAAAAAANRAEARRRMIAQSQTLRSALPGTGVLGSWAHAGQNPTSCRSPVLFRTWELGTAILLAVHRHDYPELVHPLRFRQRHCR